VNTVLVIVTVIEVLLLVAVLAGYLIAIASMLSRTLQSLKLITIGVKAIDSQVEPIASDVRGINGSLEQVAGALTQATR